MSKPPKTVADYMVIALSPVLIMALVGSLCFFLIEVFYRGQMIGGVSWVMIWFIIGIVLAHRHRDKRGARSRLWPWPGHRNAALHDADTTIFSFGNRAAGHRLVLRP
jgi:hypothetical protein